MYVPHSCHLLDDAGFADEGCIRTKGGAAANTKVFLFVFGDARLLLRPPSKRRGGGVRSEQHEATSPAAPVILKCPSNEDAVPSVSGLRLQQDVSYETR